MLGMPSRSEMMASGGPAMPTIAATTKATPMTPK